MTMDATLVEATARNNALWCDAVCRAHGRSGSFDTLLWATRLGAPRLYPDAVTIAGPASATAQYEAIVALTESGRSGGWAIKDSHAALDLTPLGFHPLFDAQWIAHRVTVPRDAAALRWRTVKDQSSLADWNAAWGDSAPFRSALLAEDDVVFLAAHHDEALVGGAILNRGAGVVGLSNVFALAPWRDAVWRDLPAQAARRFDDGMLVGYENGTDLDRAVAGGFDIIGPLRVWSRPTGDSGGASTP